MVVMKRSVVAALIAGTALMTAGVGNLVQPPVLAAVLDGFSINTQDKAVTVTLYTDQRTTYTTENNGKQFAIILPDAKLSPAQMNNGLPVVIDNKNRFIGRAVPTEDGRVKIILPNLPADDYSVSIQQKRPGQASTPAPALRPHGITTTSDETPFEQAAARLPQATKPIQSAEKTSAAPASGLRLSPPPSITAGSGTVWNPYVVKAPSVPAIGNSPYSQYKPVYNPPRKRHIPPPISDVPINTVSMAESTNEVDAPTFRANPMAALPFGGTMPTVNVPDSLANLHKLPTNLAQMPFDNLKGLAQESPFIPTHLLPPKVQPSPKAATPPGSSPFSGLKEAILALPQWLLITAAVFLSGIGVFTLIGGLVLLRILFSHARPGTAFNGMPQPAIILPPGFQFAGADGLTENKSPYATQPQAPERPTFQDTVSINALDYLKHSADNVSQAVHNTVLVKFPGPRKPNRRSARPRVPAYGRS